MPADTNVYLKVWVGPKDHPHQQDIAADIVSIDVHDEDRGTDQATIVMDNAAGVNWDVIQEGNEIRVEMGWESEHALLFIGEISPVDAAVRSRGGILRFTARDFSKRLNQRPQEAPSQGYTGTLKEILEAIVAAEPSIKMGDVRIDPMPHWGNDRQPLLQGTQSPWEMIQDIAERNNARAFVEVSVHEKDSPAERAAGGVPRLYFVSQDAMLADKPLGKLTFCHGFGSLLEFKPQQVGSGASPSSQVTAMDPASGEPVTEQGPPHAPDPPAQVSGGQVDQFRAGRGDGAAANIEARVQVANSAEVRPADRRASGAIAGTPSDPELCRTLVQQDKTRLLGLSGEGIAMGTVFLRAKGSVEIEGLSTSLSGRWYVRRVNHIVEQSRPPANSNGRRSDVILKTYRTRFRATR